MAAEFAYDFIYESSAAPVQAPQRKPQEEVKPDLRRVQKPDIDIDKQSAAAASVVKRFSAFVVFGIVCMSIVCSSFAAVRSEKLAYSNALRKLEIYQSQQVELSAQLGTLVTPDKVAKYAVEKLGMVKVADENKIFVVADSKADVEISQGE